MTFIDRLNALIKEKGINRKILTTELHIGANQIKYWENNGNIPDGTTLIKIANYFDVSVDYLLIRKKIKQFFPVHLRSKPKQFTFKIISF